MKTCQKFANEHNRRFWRVRFKIEIYERIPEKTKIRINIRYKTTRLRAQNLFKT